LSVIGSLEDLSFPDILQVIHVSRQSGTLILSARDGERRVRFRNGLVSGATLGEGGPELEELLLQKGLVDAAAVAEARERCRRAGESLSAALVAAGAVSQEIIERVVREELRSILRSLILLQEGEFRFELSQVDEGAGLGLRDGIGPEAILRGMGNRGQTRGGRMRRPPQERAGAATQGASAGEGTRRPERVILVVDRAVLRHALEQALRQAGMVAESAANVDEGLRFIARNRREDTRFALVCDLVQPGIGGEGLLGGLDLMRSAAESGGEITTVLIADARDEAALRIAPARCTAVVAAPDLVADGLEGVSARLDGFSARVLEGLHDPRRLGLGPRPAEGQVRVADQLSLLRGLIGEMRSDQEIEIPLLVLRLAAEYFERGILFSVHQGQARGAGAFGHDPGEGGKGGLDSRIRGVSLSLARGSALQRTVQYRQPYIGPIAPTRSNDPLLQRLGLPVPAEAALLPLLSGRQVFGILYGDNAASGRPIGDLRALEIFLSQAGMALENAFLQRRIESLAEGPDGRGGATTRDA
jgi:CheY-like chemotaxis protein